MTIIHLLRNFIILDILVVAFALMTGAAGAAPHIPAGDDTVLERIPKTLRLLSRDRGISAENNNAGEDFLETRLTLARRYLKAERDQGDPRYIGYAMAALEPWSNRTEPPVAFLLLKAALRQRRHDFSGALADLREVIAVQPRHPQALLTRAFILQATGRPREALESCRRLPRSLPELVAAACRARMESLLGQSERAEARLARALASDRRASAGLRAWALTVHGEIARARGDVATAIERLERALAIDDRDAYRRDAYADLLFDAGRPANVLELLRAAPPTDGHLLRRAIAGNDRALTERLRRRFASSRQRGDRPHLREAARLALHEGSQAVPALGLALENWRHQREPWDARLVLEGALAARMPDAANPVVAWISRTGIEDVTLRTLVARIKEAGK